MIASLDMNQLSFSNDIGYKSGTWSVENGMIPRANLIAVWVDALAFQCGDT